MKISLSPNKETAGLLLALFFLMGFGLVQVYSSSYLYALESYGGDGLFFFKKQILFTIISAILMVVICYLPWGLSRKLGILFWILSCIGLVATFIPGVGLRVGGAHRWLQLPWGFRFEPGELLRISSPFIVTYCLTSTSRKWGLWENPLRIFLVITPILMVLEQPDFGNFVICILVAMFLIFINGIPWRYLLAGSIALLGGFIYLIIREPYRLARIKSFLNPWADPEVKGFQIIQSLLSFHTGGLTGVGLGQGQGKLFFLPEAHTDFTMAVLGEEIGFLGFVFVLLIYGFVIFKGFQISMRSQTERDRLISAGLTITLALSIFINIGVTLGLLPTKGLALPFLSYGGSSLFCSAVASGWLLSLQRHLISRSTAQVKYE
ncbi:MAG: putative lipid II flippase FtsW [Bdellovibrionales bacterium]|nr:putative lipid II flippase FtsW [Bdellovibrionales bacterium]